MWRKELAIKRKMRFLIWILFLIPCLLSAQTEWQVVSSPNGGQITTLVIDPINPQIVFAGIDGGGVYQSLNEGESWKPKSQGLENRQVTCLALSNNEPLFYCGTQAGLFFSKDYGESWGPVNFERVKIYSIQFHPTRKEVIGIATAIGLFKSEDKGATWINITNGLPGEAIYSMIFHPSETNTLFAGTKNGIFISNDSGLTWNEAGLSNRTVISIRMHPNSKNLIFAGTLEDGAHRSYTRGTNWYRISRNLNVWRISFIECDPVEAGAIYVGFFNSGVYRTKDAGDTWELLNNNSLKYNVLSFAINPVNKNTIYVGTINGVYRSKNAGTNWTRASNGLVATHIKSLAFNPLNPTRVYIGLNGDLFQSYDTGKSWHNYNNYFLNLDISDISLFEPDTNIIWVATHGNGLYLSKTTGKAWQPKNEIRHIRKICLDATNNRRLFLATAGGVYKTLDMGETWELKNSGFGSSKISSVIIDPKNPEVLYAGSDDDGVFKSSNGGERWYPVNDGLGDLHVFSLLQYPQNDVQIVLAGTSKGIYRTENEGKNWVLIGAGNNEVNSIVKTSGLSPVFYALVDSSEVVASYDYGRNWEQLKNEAHRRFVALASVPSTFGTVFGGTWGDGLFRFQSQGAHIKINPAALDFKTLKLDSTTTQFFTIANDGISTLRISSIVASDPVFSVLKYQQNLEFSQIDTIRVQFHPLLEKKYDAVISIQSNDPSSPLVTISVTGQGIYPGLKISASKINYGKVGISEKKKKQIQVSNPGSAPLKIYDMKVKKACFVVKSQMVTLQPGAVLPVEITFAPVDTGYFQDSLIIRTNIKRQAIFLDGTGIAPKFKLSDSTYSFNKIYIGDSTSWKFKVINEGNAALQIRRIANRDSLVFQVKQKMVTVEPYSAIEVTIAFFPAVPKVYADTLVFETNDGNKKLTLSGEGVPPPLVLSAQQFDFGKLRVGNKSLPWTLTMSNPGNTPLKLIWFQGELMNIFKSQLPDSTIPAKNSFKVDFRFQPDAARSYEDTMRVKTQHYETYLVLRGEGIYPKILISDSLLSFGDVELGTSKALTFNLQNPGDDTLHVQKIELNSTLFQVDPKECRVAPGQKYTVKVNFSPVDTLEYQGQITIFSDLGENKIQVTGNGVQYFLAASDLTHDFSKVLLNTKSYWTFFLYNRGNREIKISSMKLVDGTVYSVTPSQAVIPALDSLRAMITFQPKVINSYVDTLKIFYKNNRQLTMMLKGEGYEHKKDEPFLLLNPDSVKFGKVPIGKSKSETIQLTNAGNGQLQIQKWQKQYPEFVIPTMPSKLDSGQTVSLTVVFQPGQRKSYYDELSIETNVNQQVVKLEGIGVAPMLIASHSACEFPNTMVDSITHAEVTLKNTGNDSLVIRSIQAEPKEFSVMPDSETISAGDSLTLHIKFKPQTKGVYKGWLTIISNDLSKPEFRIELTGTSLAGDFTKPSILHAPYTLHPINQPIQLSAQISDDASGIQSAKLYFRNGSESKFSGIRDFVQGSATIPATYVNCLGIEYYIEAIDGSGNLTRLPENAVFYISIQTDQDGEFRRDENGQPVSQPGGNAQTAYRMFSVPLMLETSAPSGVLGDELGEYDEKKWVFAEYNPAAGTADGYRYYNESNISGFNPGKAFWLLLKDSGIVIKSGKGQSVSSIQPYQIVVKSGWNMIANPFYFPIGLNHLNLKSGRQPVLFNYQARWDTSQTMLPWEGSAVFNPDMQQDTLWISAHATSGLKKSVAFLPEINWQIQILATCEAATDDFNTIGTSPVAADGWDDLDLPEPPGIGEFVSVYFKHTDRQNTVASFTSDFQQPALSGNNWAFEVKTNITNSEVVLKFQGLESLPENFIALLIDEQLQLSYNLSDKNEYLFQTSGSPDIRKFSIVVGNSDYIKLQQADLVKLPTGFGLNPCFPNPAPGETIIHYSIAQAGPISLTVYNLQGQKIKTILKNQWSETGIHGQVWDGTDESGAPVANGIYFYQLQAQQNKQVRKVTIIR